MPPPDHPNDALPASPTTINYLSLLWLSLHDERRLVRKLARSGLLDKLEATRVHSTTSANEELPQRPQHSFKSEDM